MLVEDTDGLRWSKAKFPKDPFCLLLCLRFNAGMYNCSFHNFSVSHSQHRCKMFFSFLFSHSGLTEKLSRREGQVRLVSLTRTEAASRGTISTNEAGSAAANVGRLKDGQILVHSIPVPRFVSSSSKQQSRHNSLQVP